jgi:hypothetical protein
MIVIRRLGLIAAGGLAGGVIGYFLGGLIVNQLEKRNEELEEDAWLKEVYEGKADSGGPTEVQVAKQKDYTKYAKGELAELVKPYTSSISEEPNKKRNIKADKIRIITAEEYERNRATAKEPIAYYEEDTTFADAQEEIIDDPNRLFGANIHLHFGEESDDPDIVYVRNENTGVDYEITRVHNSYSIFVMGMSEGTAKKETKAKTRRKGKKVTADDDEDTEDEREG